MKVRGLPREDAKMVRNILSNNKKPREILDRRNGESVYLLDHPEYARFEKWPQFLDK